ncbi:MAG: hypothetical protein CMJ81_05120 [Planctomycetaceae bacterium]|nr:hypothetical protein [Planctomycetaceae bacterium]
MSQKTNFRPSGGLDNPWVSVAEYPRTVLKITSARWPSGGGIDVSEGEVPLALSPEISENF